MIIKRMKLLLKYFFTPMPSYLGNTLIFHNELTVFNTIVNLIGI